MKAETPTSDKGPSPTEAAEETLATQVTVGSQPDICKTPAHFWQKQMLVTIGVVRFEADSFGWGPAGSIWNISTGGGAKLVRMEARCQGRTCEIDGPDGPGPRDGKMTQREDGSWFLQTTPGMQSSLMISGLLLAENAGLSNQKYPLSVSSMIACWLPVAINCTNEGFVHNQTQWRAYDVVRYLGHKLTPEIRSYYDFGAMVMKAGMPTEDAIDQACAIDQDLDCSRPKSKDCADHPDADHVRDLMLVDSYITFTQLMRVIYKAMDDAKNDVKLQVDRAIDHIWKEVAKKVWLGAKQASVASSILGLLIGAGVILQVVLAILFAPAAPALVAADAGLAAAEGGAGAVAAEVEVGAAQVGRVAGQAAGEAGPAEQGAVRAGQEAEGSAARKPPPSEDEITPAEPKEKGNPGTKEEGEASATKEGEAGANGEKGKPEGQKESSLQKSGGNMAGLFVGAAIFGSNGPGLYANLDNMKSNPEDDDTISKAKGHYYFDVENILNHTQSSLVEAMESKDTGPDRIKQMFGDGQWVTEELKTRINDKHLQRDIKDWYVRQMIGHTVTKILWDNNAYILFVEFGEKTHWISKKQGFTQEECEKYWVGNPDWKFAATCDIPYKPGGPLGMAVIARPPVEGRGQEGSETKQWFADPMEFEGHKINASTVIASAMHGQYHGGFGYSLRNNDDWFGRIEEDGLDGVAKKIVNKDPYQAGLYSVPVCAAIVDLVYVPGSWAGMSHWRKYNSKRSDPDGMVEGSNQTMISENAKRYEPSPYGDESFNTVYANGPCPCQDYRWKDKAFTDSVRSKVTDNLKDVCGHDEGVHRFHPQNPLPNMR